MAANKRKILEAARKYAQKGAKDRALKEYEQLLRLDPKDAKLRLEIGDAYRRWGQVDEAITRYEALIRARDRSMGWEPQQSWYDAHYRLASLYAGRGNAARARELLTALLTYWKDADPDLPLVLRARRLQEQISR